MLTDKDLIEKIRYHTREVEELSFKLGMAESTLEYFKRELHNRRGTAFPISATTGKLYEKETND